MKLIKYSIIIPHKNTFFELKRLLESIIEDDMIEIIVIDDHSDSSIMVDLTKSDLFKGNRKLIKAVGKGAGNARNEGIAISKGKWLLFSDSDDLFETNLKENLEKNCKDDLDLIYFYPKTQNVVKSDYRQRYTELFDKYLANPIEKNEWDIRLNFDVPWSKVVKKDLINKNNIQFDNTRKQNDTIFSQKIGIYSKKILICKESIYKVIGRENSITHQKSKEVFEDALTVRINSYLLKINTFPQKKLKEIDSYVIETPIMTVINSLRDYKDIKYSYFVYTQFKKNQIPVFSLDALRCLLAKIVKKTKERLV